MPAAAAGRSRPLWGARAVRAAVPAAGGSAAARGGFARGMFFVLLSLLLIPMVAVGWLVLLAIAGMAFGPNPSDRIITTTVQEGDSQEEIAVVPLVGEIDEAAARRIDRCLTRIQNQRT